MDLWVTQVKFIGVGLALALLGAGSVAGCGDLELGAAPFKCNEGKPKCPKGYECTKNICVLEGTCPWPAVPGCPARPAVQASADHRHGRQCLPQNHELNQQPISLR